MSLRTPLARVRGLGAAKHGAHHWLAQRLTAVALVPLTLWFVIAVITHVSSDYATVVTWVRSPIVTALLVLFVGAVFYHAQLGMQVVIEDYFHTPWLKVTSLVLVKLFSILLAFVCIAAVLRIAFGS